MKAKGITQAVKQRAEKATSGKENLVEDRARHTPSTEKIVKDLQIDASPWVSTKSFNTKLSSSVAVHDSKLTQNFPVATKTLSRSKRSKKASVDHTVQPFGSKRFGLDSYKNRLSSFCKGSSAFQAGKVSNAENIPSKSGFQPEKDLAEDKNKKTEPGGSEALRMKLWEVIGNVSSPDKQCPSIQSIKIGAKDFNPELEKDGKENPKEKTNPHSDTIESDSERPDIFRTPLTHSLTTKKVYTRKQHSKIEATKLNSHKKDCQEKSTISARGDGSRRPCETVDTGILHCNSLRNKSAGENFENPAERWQSCNKSKSVLSLRTSMLQGNKAENGHSSSDRRRDILREIESGMEIRHSFESLNNVESCTKIRNSLECPNNVMTEQPSANGQLRAVETPKFKIQQVEILNYLLKNRDDINKPQSRASEMKLPVENSPGCSPLGLQEKDRDLSDPQEKNDTERIVKILLNSKSTGSKANGHVEELSNGCEEVNDYPPSKPTFIMEENGDHSISGSSSAATDSENSEDDFHIKGCKKLESLSPEIGITKHFLRSRRLCKKKGVGLTGCSPTLESLKETGNEESGKSQMCMEQENEDGFASAVALLTVALDRVQTKMKLMVEKRSAEILMEAADGIHLQLKHADSQITKDVEKLINHSKVKRRRLDARYQEQHEQLVGIWKRFESEVDQHLQGYEHLVEDLEEFGTELEGNVKRHKASNEKFLSLAEQAINVQLDDAERKILAAQELIGFMIPTDDFDVQWLHHVILKSYLNDFRLGANANHLAAVAVSRLQGELAKDGREPATSAFKRSRENVVPEKVTQARSAELGKDKKALDLFCVDLTARASSGLIDPVIGREREVRRIVQILCRRTKSNPILLGEAGVGKTAIAEGLAIDIAEGNVPFFLMKKRVLSLDIGLLIAGAKERGELEGRVTMLIKEIKKSGNIILFIDEVHTLIGSGTVGRGNKGSGLDIANLLKPALGRSEMQCIASTTMDEFRLHFEKDKALARRFQPVLINEPSQEDAVQILLGLRETYESHHKCRYTLEAINAAVHLSARYIPDRYLPDKAIDLIDEAGSRARMEACKRRKEMQTSILSKSPADYWKEIRAAQAMHEVSLEVELIENSDISRMEDNDKLTFEPLLYPSPSDDEFPVVGPEDIAAVASLWSGIPVKKLTADERMLLVGLDEQLKKRVVGQDEAVAAISRAVKRSRVGLKNPDRPIAAMLFCGPTGVGKTELTKALAASYFGSESAMLRLDMSEYMERHTVSKLIGSPPGYVGYGEGGTLTEAIRKRPFTVILLDEIEKAHPDIFNILLQLFEDGHLTDSQGRRVSFKNALVVMTSNIGSAAIAKGRQNSFGFFTAEDSSTSYAGLKTLVMEELKGYFRPELLNRIDEVVVFRALEKPQMLEILDIMLHEVKKRLTSMGIGLEISEPVMDLICQQGYDRSYGARPLRRAVTLIIEDLLSESILSGDFKPGDVAVIQLDETGNPVVRNQKIHLSDTTTML
ncbi:chaperone protein ClpD, chloroplastic [Dorcoceras hygrometricum]|uniref:Chaperone protein ClpD, chloroplastic n=1 Tax=Dorcoceras hygrometricum TaxID=472368 RepID=A0A2Z7AN84_9LAMI|nr:chaperone protein ClpD, chloroplastic [Dorcoceras hygrometricum]